MNTKGLTERMLAMGVVLVALYIGAQCIADVGATKMLALGGIVLPAGSLMFAVTFTLRDLLHKQLGRRLTLVTIGMGAAVNLLLAGYLWGMAQLPAPPFFGLAVEWGQVFAWVPSITIGSILAEMLSQWVDTEVYELWVRRVTRRFQWSRVVVSNACGLVVDSFAFGLLGFALLPRVFGGEAYPVGIALTLGLGQVVYKAAVTLVSLPLIYIVRDGPGLAPRPNKPEPANA